MDAYTTEEEQVAAIKRFADKHGSKLLAALVVFIASVLFYQNYQKTQLQDKENASLYFSKLSQMTDANATLDEKQQAAFDQNFSVLAQQYPDSIYASFAALLKAKLEVNTDDLDEAAKSLQWVIDASHDEQMVDLAKLRLAKVLFAQDKKDEALAILEKGSDTLAAQYAVLEGDIVLSQDNSEKALALYKKAEEVLKAEDQQIDQLLKVKISSLQSVESAEKAPETNVQTSEESAQ